MKMLNISRYIIVIFIAAITFFLLWYFSNIVAYVLISAVVALIGQPLVDLLCRIHIKKVRFPRGIAALITLILLWVAGMSFFRFFIPLVADQATELSSIDVDAVLKNMADPLAKAEAYFEKLNVAPGEQKVTLQDYAKDKIGSLLSVTLLSDFFSGVGNLLGNIFIAMFSISFISFFFLKDDRMFVNALLLLVPSRHEQRVRNALGSVNTLLKRYFIGIILEMSLIMLLLTIGLSIVGLELENTLVIALFAGIINVVPYVGPIVGILFGMAIGITTHLHFEFYKELLPFLGLMLLVFFIVQLIDNVFFQPLIYSNSVNAHPLEIFLVISIAGSFAGMYGMVLAIPGYTILRVFSKEFFNRFKVVQKLTEKI